MAELPNFEVWPRREGIDAHFVQAFGVPKSAGQIPDVPDRSPNTFKNLGVVKGGSEWSFWA